MNFANDSRNNGTYVQSRAIGLVSDTQVATGSHEVLFLP